MMHRIRLTMKDDSTIKLSGECEADETFVRGKARNMHLAVNARRITGTGTKFKDAVLTQPHTEPKTVSSHRLQAFGCV